jgi:DnaJ-class molecular chaperone
MLPDYYEQLGVPASASGREIEAAYWQRIRERRDLVPVLNEAIEVLTNEERRVAYDRRRHEQLQAAEGRRAASARAGSALSKRLSERWGY